MNAPCEMNASALTSQNALLNVLVTTLPCCSGWLAGGALDTAGASATANASFRDSAPTTCGGADSAPTGVTVAMANDTGWKRSASSRRMTKLASIMLSASASSVDSAAGPVSDIHSAGLAPAGSASAGGNAPNVEAGKKAKA